MAREVLLQVRREVPVRLMVREVPEVREALEALLVQVVLAVLWALAVPVDLGVL